MGGRVLVGGGQGVSDWGQRVSVEMLDVQPVESTRPWEQQQQHDSTAGKAGLDAHRAYALQAQRRRMPAVAALGKDGRISLGSSGSGSSAASMSSVSR